ncbi:hypothetical protein ACFL1V_09715 [Pseudomonadota bacterium]
MRFLFLLIVVLLLAVAWWPDPPAMTVEETFIAPQLVPLNKAKGLEQDYLEGLDKKKEQIEEQSGGN